MNLSHSHTGLESISGVTQANRSAEFERGVTFGQREMVREIAILQQQLQQSNHKLEQCNAKLVDLRRAKKASNQKVRRRDTTILQFSEKMEKTVNKLLGKNGNQSQIHSEVVNHISTSISRDKPFLSALAEHLHRNNGRQLRGVRYSDHMKSFGRTLFLWGGYKAYNFVAKNLLFLPSADTIRKEIKSTKPFIEGIVEEQIIDVCNYLKEAGTSKYLILHEDGTRVKQGIMWDHRRDAWVGLARDTPLISPTYEELQKLTDPQLANYANTAYVYMVTPVDGKFPSQVVAILPSDNRFTNDDVLCRWKTIGEIAEKQGFHVIVHTSDGDGKLMKAMLRSTNFVTAKDSPSSFPPAKWFLRYTEMDGDVPVWNMQDAIHCFLKLRNSLINGKKWLFFSNSTATRDVLDDLMYSLRSNLALTAQHLRAEDIKIEDKQNFPSADRLASSWTRAQLAKHCNIQSQGTIFYLEAMANVVDAFYDLELTVEQRVVKLWTTVWFYRLWRTWIASKAGAVWDRDVHFITTNSFQSVELIGHAFIGILYNHAKYEITEFKPWLFTSQPCEKFFRQSRTTGGNNTLRVNYFLLELLHDTRRMGLALQDRQKNYFDYANHRKHSHSRDDIPFTQKGLDCSEVTFEKLDSWVRQGFDVAKQWTGQLGMNQVLDGNHTLTPDSNWHRILKNAFNYQTNSQVVPEEDIVPDEIGADAPVEDIALMEPPEGVSSIQILMDASSNSVEEPNDGADAEVESLPDTVMKCTVEGNTTRLHKATLAANFTRILNLKLSKDRELRVAGKNAASAQKAAKKASREHLLGLDKGGFGIFVFQDSKEQRSWYLGRVLGMWLNNCVKRTLRRFALDPTDGNDAHVCCHFWNRNGNKFLPQAELVPTTYSIKSSLLGVLHLPLHYGAQEVTLPADIVAAIDSDVRNWSPITTPQPVGAWPLFFGPPKPPAPS